MYKCLLNFNIFRNIPPLSSEASLEEKDNSFKKFLVKSERALKHYKVLYLKGINRPLSYEDILPVKVTTYADIKWEADIKPAHGLFSIKGKLTDAEVTNSQFIIKSILKDILD